jgi:UDP-N-acetylmuramoyl-tripeptide--D-alanyl-D-alanine ligase
MTIEDIYNIYKKYPFITTDSRECPKNSIFFALKGEKFNGNKFAQTALNNGCEYAIVDEAEFATNNQIILVDNCLETLQQLAKLHRQTLKTPIIGITGTNGKTTTKELISAVLSRKYNTIYTKGNLNNHIGVPLTLLTLTDKHELAVIEMGANHPGEIKTLVEIACPNFGIITNVGKAHLEGFGSFENIIKTKGELYDYIRQTNGTIFINADNPFLTEISTGLTKIQYSLKTEQFISGNIIDCSPMLEISWKKENDTESYVVKSNLIGTYNAENLLAAISFGTFLNIKPKEICTALENYIPQNNRSQLKKTTKNSLVIDAYNANPTSMEAAIRNFDQMNVRKKIVILGDMRELGEESIKEHQRIIDMLEKSHFDEVFLIGENFSSLKSEFESFLTTEDFISILKKRDLAGYYILIKGSRGMKMERTIEFL